MGIDIFSWVDIISYLDINKRYTGVHRETFDGIIYGEMELLGRNLDYQYRCTLSYMDVLSTDLRCVGMRHDYLEVSMFGCGLCDHLSQTWVSV